MSVHITLISVTILHYSWWNIYLAQNINFWYLTEIISKISCEQSKQMKPENILLSFPWCVKLIMSCSWKQGDECGNLANFSAPSLEMNYSFSNFSFKVRIYSPEGCYDMIWPTYMNFVMIRSFFLFRKNILLVHVFSWKMNEIQ